MILEKNDLFKKLKAYINNNLGDKNLTRQFYDTFNKKKLNAYAVQNVQEGSVEIKNLEVFEQIAIAETIYEYTKREKRYEYTNYFSEKELNEYNVYTPVDLSKGEEEGLMIFENFIKEADGSYRGSISYSDLVKYFSKMWIRYNLDTQRANAYEKVGNTTVRKAAYDNKAVEEIKEAVLNKTFEDTEIILNVRLIDFKEPRLNFKTKYKEVFGDLEITANYLDFNDPNYTVIDILDGYHRILAIQRAWNQRYQEGLTLEGHISVRIVFADIERALRIVTQTFKKSATDKGFLATINKNDYTLLVDEIEKKSSYLTKVAKTYDEAMATNAVAYKAIMVSMAEKLRIPSKSMAERNSSSKKIATFIDEFYNSINEFIYIKVDGTVRKEENLEKILKHPNFIAILIAYANNCMIIKNEELDYEHFVGLTNAIKHYLEIGKFEEIKIYNKNCSTSKIIRMFGGK